MININNNITPDQWQQILDSADASRIEHDERPDSLYITTTDLNNKTRHIIYDNYERLHMPGLDYIVEGNQKTGRLYVYNSSKMARAPISLNQGLAIARNFFNEYGSRMSEEIVNDYFMLTNLHVKF